MDRSAAGNGAPSPGWYRCGDVVVDVAAHVLLRDGAVQPVEPKAFAVLLLLLQHAGQLVERDVLLDAVWGHRHVTPGVLTRVIAQLRHALGDDPHQPTFIQTLHGLGYRFIGDLLPEPDGAEAEVPPRDRRSSDEDRRRALAAATLAGTQPPEPQAGLPADGPASRTEPAQPEPGSIAPAEAIGELALPVQPGDEHGWQPPGLPVDAEPSSPGAADPAQPLPAAERAIANLSRSMQLFAIAAVIVAVGFATVLWGDRDVAPARPLDASVAVMPFTSLSTDRQDSYFAEGLSVELHDALAGVKGLKIAARESAVAMRHRDLDVKQLGKTLGVATVLDASVRRDGNRVRISARLSDTGTGFTLWADTFDREMSDVFTLQSEIANEVVQALLGVLPSDQGALARRLSPTRNLGAYDAYLKGRLQLAQPISAASLDRAIAFFSQALAADSGFARAQAGICRAEIRRFESARDAPAFARAQQACQRAATMDPGLREVSLALGEMYRVRGEPKTAIEHYTRAMDDNALRPDAYIGLGRAQSADGNHALALEYFKRALALRPGDGRVYRELGYHYYLRGDVPRAIDSFRTAAALQPDDGRLWSSLGGLYLVSGDNVRANDAFMRSLAIGETYEALSNLGTLNYMTGEYAEAAALFQRAARHEPDDHRTWGNLGDALAEIPARAGDAQTSYRRAAGLLDRYVAVNARDAHALAALSWYRANLGEDNAARVLLARAEAIPDETGEVALYAALTLAQLGDRQGARQRVLRARDAGIPQTRIDALPVLRGLGGAGVAPPVAPAGLEDAKARKATATNP